MIGLFLVHNGREYSYAELSGDVMRIAEYRNYVYISSNDPYELFLRVTHSLVYGYSIELLDGDFTVRELEQLGITEDLLSETSPILEQHIGMYADVDFKEILSSRPEWTITLYTSGTTGRPKKIVHSLRSLTRAVKTGNAYHDNVWAFCYNPTHIAGLQVFFQALMNRNTIIYAFDGAQKHLATLISRYRITHLSATSTYYRSVLHYMEGTYATVRRVTFGGEQFDSRIAELAKRLFPHAKINNIYASTEAGHLFVSSGEVFSVLPEMRELVRIQEDGELILHVSLLGLAGAVGHSDEWFFTGDIVEPIDGLGFRFLTRRSDFINVGGYNVNPLEIEQCLLDVPGVADLVVKAAVNSITGNIITLEVLAEPEYDKQQLKAAIKRYASEHLQAWKVPRIITMVEQLQRSRTAKKVRT